MQLRIKSIKYLQECVETWYLKIGQVLHYELGILESKMAKLLIFGSYRLGVHFQGTDIDTIAVFPNFISISSFLEDFKTFVSTYPKITDVLRIQEA